MGNVEGAAQAIADALAPTQQPPSARWRWGTVASVQDDGTITATVGGTTVSGIRAAQQAMGAVAGDRVRICYLGTEAFADSLRAPSKLMRLPTIDGALTATGRITGVGLASDGANAALKSTNITSNTEVTAYTNGNGNLVFRDSAGAVIGFISPTFVSGGVQQMVVLAQRNVNGTTVYNVLRLGIDASGNAQVALEGTNAQTAWRNALGAVGASDQSRQNARFFNFVGADQIYGLYATCINANNTDFNGKNVGAIFRNGGISLYNGTNQTFPWQISGLSGDVNLDTTAWQTLASGVTYRRHRGWVVVNIDNHAYTGSGSEVALGTLPTGYRPSRWSYNALLSTGVGATQVPYVSVDPSGNVKVNGRASGAKLFGEIVFPV